MPVRADFLAVPHFPTLPGRARYHFNRFFALFLMGAIAKRFHEPIFQKFTFDGQIQEVIKLFVNTGFFPNCSEGLDSSSRAPTVSERDKDRLFPSATIPHASRKKGKQ